jgi:DNA modification methylase
MNKIIKKILYINMQLVNIQQIRNNENNPRIIKDYKFKQLVKSIKEFPEMLKLRPIVVNSEMVVLGGNMRLKACKEAGLTEVWILKADELTEEQQREFIVKDNVGFGEWDWDVLANEWNNQQLEDWGLDLLPFEEDEVLEAKEDDFDTTPPEIAKTVLGDLYEIGEHRLLCGDSTCSDTVVKLMNGEKADMVFTDPPYGIAVKNTKGDILGDENLDVFEECMPNILLSVKESTHAYIFFGSKLAEQSLLILNKYFKQYNLLIMPITNQTQPYPEGYFSSNYEICYFTNINGVKKHNSGILSVSETTKKDNRYNGDGFLKKYYALSEQPITEHNANVLHPTQKNVNGIDFYIKISSNENDLILDLFLGSGSTMVASHQLKRKCYGMELDPKYCDVIVKRMIKLDDTLTIKRNGIDCTNEWK